MSKKVIDKDTKPKKKNSKTGSLKSEDYDTTHIVKESEDNWDNEGGIFANPDEEYKEDTGKGGDTKVEEGSYGGHSPIRRRTIKSSGRRQNKKTGSASRVKHSGVSISGNKNKKGNTSRRSGKK